MLSQKLLLYLLLIIAYWKLKIKSSDQIVFADMELTSARSVGELFESFVCPDLAVMGDSTVSVPDMFA